jgi:four helix bundle protein
MPTIITYKDLETWQVAMDFVERVYRSTSPFPASELYGLTVQLRRAAVSIPSNVAEGYCRKSLTKVYLNHVSIALGSHGEIETCIEIASRLGFLPDREKKPLLVLCDSVGRLLNGLHRSLEMRLANEEGRR